MPLEIPVFNLRASVSSSIKLKCSCMTHQVAGRIHSFINEEMHRKHWIQGLAVAIYEWWLKSKLCAVASNKELH